MVSSSVQRLPVPCKTIAFCIDDTYWYYVSGTTEYSRLTADRWLTDRLCTCFARRAQLEWQRRCNYTSREKAKLRENSVLKIPRTYGRGPELMYVYEKVRFQNKKSSRIMTNLEIRWIPVLHVNKRTDKRWAWQKLLHAHQRRILGLLFHPARVQRSWTAWRAHIAEHNISLD